MSVPRIAPLKGTREFKFKQSKYPHLDGMCPVRALVIGPSGSSKTTTVTNLIVDVFADAWERTIIFSKNAKTAMILGQARGAAISACAQFDIPIAEHSPRTIKQAVTGNGSSQKDQVAKMVMRLLRINEQPQEDAADALAIAICHYHQLNLPEPLRSPNI